MVNSSRGERDSVFHSACYYRLRLNRTCLLAAVYILGVVLWNIINERRLLEAYIFDRLTGERHPVTWFFITQWLSYHHPYLW